MYSRLFILHTRMVEYIESEAECFLKKYWLQRSGHSAKQYSEQMGTLQFFPRMPAACEANMKELKEGLITPTMNMLDMVILFTLFLYLGGVRTVQILTRPAPADLQTRRHPGRPPLVDAQ